MLQGSHRRGSLAMAMVWVFAAAWTAHAQSPRFERQPQERQDLLVAAALEQDPVIDGDLSDPAWTSAATVSGFWRGGARELAEQQTRVWIAFRADKLFVAFAAEDRDIRAERYDHDSYSVWKNDAVEVILFPTQQASQAVQFVVGAAGATYDRRQASGAKLKEQTQWNPPTPWQSAVKRTADGYDVEICIPLAALDEPGASMQPGARWGLKLARLDLGPTDTQVLSSWTSMGQSTSDPNAMGTLAFARSTLLSNPGAELADDAGGPLDWQLVTYEGATITASRSSADKVEGQFAARYELNSGKVVAKHYRVFPGGALPPLQRSQETVYRWQASIKVENPEQDLLAYLVSFSGAATQQIKLKHNAGWQRVEAVFTVPPRTQPTLPCIQGVALVSTSPRERGGGVILVDDVSLELVDASTLGLAEGEVCLTGNATGPLHSRNAAVAGFYTYSEPGTIAAEFPWWWPGRQMQEPGLYQGWIPFAKGRLTDGHTATAVAWGGFWTGPLGHDLTFDLGREHEIMRVVVIAQGSGGGDALWLRSDSEPRFALVDDKRDQLVFNAGQAPPPPREDGAVEFRDIRQPARWVRISHRDKNSQPSEVQIWGRPLSAGATLTRKPYHQGGGKVVHEQPSGQPIRYDSTAGIFPVPQQMAVTGTNTTTAMSSGLAIVYEPAQSERARITAEVLAEELGQCFGIEARVISGAAKIALPPDQPHILLGLAAQSPRVEAELQSRNLAIPQQADGYVLDVRGPSILIAGRDDRGAFYGTQSLLSLVRRQADQWAIPQVNIRDWPSLPIRYIQGRPEPSKALIRALARFRVTHYEASARFNDVAAKFDSEAQRYFVQFVPMMDFNTFVLQKDASLVERRPDETPESLGHGRRNANPGHARSWELYLAECDRLLPKFHGDMVHINFDETYIEHMGARWNVSAESRALNLSAGPLLAHVLNRIDAKFKQYGKRIAMHDTAFLGHKLSYVGDPDPAWNKALPLIPRDIRFLVWHPKEVNELLGGMGFSLTYLALDELDWRQIDLKPYQGLTAYMAESAFTASKLLDLVGVAWNSDAPRPYEPQARNAVNRAIQLWNQLHLGVRLPSTIAAEDDFEPIDLSRAANDTRVDAVAFDGRGGPDLGPSADLRAVAPGRQSMAGVPFVIVDESANQGRGIVTVHNRGYADRTFPSEAVIEVGSLQAASLVFLHCLDSRPGHNYLRRKELAGFYVVEYADGRYDIKEIKYAVNTANFDGRPVMSGYNPRGHNMTDGSLAWEGQSRSGMPVFLYSSEWVNPRPDVAIVRLRLRAAHVMGNMNPMLLGLTAVKAKPGLNAAPAQPPTPRPLTFLAAPTPVGNPLDLRGGTDESEHRYVAPDGTVIEAGPIDNTTSDRGESSGAWYRSYVGILNHDGNQVVRSDTVTFRFAKPRAMTGVMVTAAYRLERKTENFEAAVHDLTLEVSSDGGTTWRQAASYAGARPDEQGPVWLGLDGQAITHARIKAANRGSAQGFAHVQWYERP